MPIPVSTGKGAAAEIEHQARRFASSEGFGLTCEHGEFVTPIDARIDHATWMVTLSLDTRAEAAIRHRLMIADNEEVPLEIIVDAVCRLQFSHWQWCPFDGDQLARIVEAVTKVVVAKKTVTGEGRSKLLPDSAELERVVRRHTHIFCSIVAASCAAAWGRDRGRFVNGIALHWRSLLRAEERPPKDFIVALGVARHAVFAGYESSEPVKMLLREIQAWIDRDRDAPTVVAALGQALAGLGLQDEGYPACKPARSGLSASSVGDAAALLCDRYRWPERAVAFTSALGDLVADSPWPNGNLFKRSAAVSPEKGRHKRMRSRPPSQPLTTEFCDHLYRARSEVLDPIFLTPKAAPFGDAPVGWLGVRRVGRRDRAERGELKLAATRLIPTSEGDELQLYQRVNPVTRRTRDKRGAPPDLAFILDSSESMAWNPLAGEGAYDLVLRVVYATLRWLTKQDVADRLRYAVVNFSSRTQRSPWVTWQRLDEVKPVLFMHQDSRSRLRTEVLDDMVDEAARRFVAIVITDGKLDTAVDRVADALSRMAGAGHVPIYIEISQMPTDLLRAVAGRGIEVHQIAHVQDLPAVAIGRLATHYAS